MKCNLEKGIDVVCYKYEKCILAYKCKNVPKGIRNKLKNKIKFPKQQKE